MSDALGMVVPGLEIALKSLAQIYEAVQDVKLCRRRCDLLSDRCRQLIDALEESSRGLEGQTSTMILVDEVIPVIQHVERRVSRWGALNRLQTFIAQGDIKEGLDTSEKKINVALEKFQLGVSLGNIRIQNESREAYERGMAELHELLAVLRDQKDRRVSLHEEPDALEEVMSVLQEEHDALEEAMSVLHLQEELRQPGLLGAERGRNLREGLLDLVEQSGALLADLTGRVQMKPGTPGIVFRGAFNDVFLGQCLGKDVALRLPRELSNSPDVRRRFQREVKVWHRLGKHPNIVPLYGSATIGSEVYCVSPWMDNGTAISFVQKHPEFDVLRLLKDIATGMEFLHDNNVIHGDLRGNNVLISRKCIARISDFGLSVFLEQCRQGMSMLPSSRWSAPELFSLEGAYSTSSDVWSFGMVMLELLTGRPPFHECSLDLAVMREIDKGHIPQRPAQLKAPTEACDRLWTLMKDCWKQAAKRPSMTEVKTRLIGICEEPASKKVRPLRLFRRTRPGSESSGEGFGHTRGSSSQLNTIRQRQPLSPSSEYSFDSSGRHSQLAGTGRMASTTSMPNFPISESPNLDDIPISVSAPSGSDHTDTLVDFDWPTESRPDKCGTVTGVESVLMTPESTNISLPSSESSSSQCAPSIKVDGVGQVMPRTFDALIGKLLCTSTGELDLEFRKVFLSTCNGFSSHQSVFLALLQRYRDADRPGTLAAQRVPIQHTIYRILLAWLSDKRLPIEPAVLEQMKELCSVHRSPERSETMSRLSNDTLAAIQDRECGSTPLLSPTSPSINSHVSKTAPCDIDSEGCAKALTKHQAKLFDAITPADWLQFIQVGEDPSSTVSAALAASRTIGKWVTRTLLRDRDVNKRVGTLCFFLEVAQGCRTAGNFEGVAAIVGALGAAPIAGLKEMGRHLTQRETASINALTELVRRAPGRGYERYHAAIASKKDSVVVVPLLGALKEELESVLQQKYRRRHVNNDDIIDFEQFSDFYRCAELARQGVRFAPECADICLEYTERQLRKTARWDATHEQMMEETRKLEEADVTDRKNRIHASRRIGF